MNRRLKQKKTAWSQNSKIRKVPYWKSDWMDKNPSSQGYNACMREYEENQEYIAIWKQNYGLALKNPAVYRY